MLVINKQKEVKMKKIDKNVIIIALAVLLVIAILYIGISSYSSYKEQRNIVIFEQGAQAGYTQAITQLVNMVMTCQQVPLSAGNNSINVIAVECLQQQ
jgi:flagellar basal body-associated protein FliL